MKMYDAQKAKGLFIKLKYKKFQASISKRDVKIKNDQLLWIVKKPNEKFQRYVIIFLWEVIYVYFYNWDRPLDLVLVVYDLIKLIVEASSRLRTIPHLIHTQHTCLMLNKCFIHLFDCTCLNVMCVCSIIYGSIQKDFWSFYMFLKVIFITLCVHV